MKNVLTKNENLIEESNLMREDSIKVIAYLRRSKADRNGQSLSFEYQKRQIKRFISSQEDWKLVKFFQDEGFSGALPVEKRPGLKALQGYCHSEVADKVIVFKLDRLFRDTREALTLAKELREKGIGLVSTSEIIDTNSAWGRFMLTMQFSVATLEREIISERTVAALDVKKGKREHLGHVPFGFTRKRGKLAPDPIEQEHLKKMRKLREEGKSYSEIAERISEQGIPTHQNSQRWYGSTINRVLHQKHLGQFVLES